jgi:hypothetical protein
MTSRFKVFCFLLTGLFMGSAVSPRPAAATPFSGPLQSVRVSSGVTAARVSMNVINPFTACPMKNYSTAGDLGAALED